MSYFYLIFALVFVIGASVSHWGLLGMSINNELAISCIIAAISALISDRAREQ
jgi:hypothetical protein